MENQKTDWELNPPERVRVEVSGWSRDVSGNSAARYFLRWNNGKAGDARCTGTFRSPRREQVGCKTHVTGGAMGRLPDLFPGTRWKIAGEIKGGRAEGFAAFEAVRDYDAEPVPFLFRAEPIPASSRKVHGATLTDPARVEVTAVFPTFPGTDESDVTIYAHIGQHGTGCRGWYRETRKATEAQAAPLRRELESIGYVLDIKARWTAQHDVKRAANYHANREAI